MARKKLTAEQKAKRAANRKKYWRLFCEYSEKGDNVPMHLRHMASEYYQKAQEYYRLYLHNGGRDRG